nr:GNAT family N-acetyltransferase [Microlunatus antarcticus]
MLVRDATSADAQTCAEIYAPYVAGTAASFETDPPTPAEVARRIAVAQQHHAWLVAERDGAVLGYAYGTDWKSRPAYRWTCETSVYVADGRRGGGVGRTLYDALLARLTVRGFRTVIASMTLPNTASARLHEALGFRPVGVLSRVGWKNGRWHDVALLRCSLGPDPAETDDAPPEPS